jgi:mono/diheme cytochrome c family protein
MKNLIFAAALLTAGCHSIRRGEPIVGALQLTDPKVKNGRKVYMQHCQQCHPNGEAGLAPALNNKPAPRFLVKRQIRWGLGAMPSFNKREIPKGDLDDVVAFVMALRKQDSENKPPKN